MSEAPIVALAPFIMRKPCVKCGGHEGEVRTRGAQDCVFCKNCDAFQYNAPRTETGKAIRTVTTIHNGIKPKQRARVLVRANCACELCGKRLSGTHVELHVGHFLSVKDGFEMGLPDDEINDDENLFAVCAECNLGLGSETLPVRLVMNILMARLRMKRKASP